MRVQLADQVIEALAGGGRGGDDRGLPVPLATTGHRDHAAQVADGLLGAGLVALVDHEHVADFQDARLGRLDRVAQARGHDDQGGVGHARDLHLSLAHPDRLDQDHVETGRVQHPHGLRGGPGQPAQMTAAGHGPDEHSLVRGVLLHPHPVPEQGTPGEWRRGIDGQHADPQPLRAIGGHQGPGDRGLAHPRGAGEPEHPGLAGERGQGLHHRAQLRRTVLHQRQEPAQGPRVTVAGPLNDLTRAGRRVGDGPVVRDGRARLSHARPRGHLEQQRAALATATAQRGRAQPAAATAQLVDQVQGDPGPGRPDGVAQRDGAAVHVDLLVPDAQVPHGLDGDGGERLVDLDQVQVGHAQASPAERAPDRGRRLGLQRGVRAGHDTVRADRGQHRRTVLRRRLGRHHHDGGRAVRDLRRGGGRDRAVGGERGPQRRSAPPRWCPAARPRRCRTRPAHRGAAAPGRR